jgi:hypothetical protein
MNISFVQNICLISLRRLLYNKNSDSNNHSLSFSAQNIRSSKAFIIIEHYKKIFHILSHALDFISLLYLVLDFKTKLTIIQMIRKNNNL